MEEYFAVIKIFASNFAPRGYAFCHGQLLSISGNTALFSLLGVMYGGDGKTTFALPDLRGRMAIGAGQGPGLNNYVVGQITGNETVTLAQPQLPMHGHTFPSNIAPAAASSVGNSNNPSNAYYANSGTVKNYGSIHDASMGVADVSLQPAGGSQPVSIVQPYLVMNYIICTSGIFPPRD